MIGCIKFIHGFFLATNGLFIPIKFFFKEILCDTVTKAYFCFFVIS